MVVKDYFFIGAKKIMCGLLIISFTIGMCSIDTVAKKVQTKRIQVNEGENYKIKSHRNNSYSSSRPKVAYVSKKGVIRGRKKGMAVIKVYCKNKVTRKYIVAVKKDRSLKTATSLKNDKSQKNDEAIVPTLMPDASSQKRVEGIIMDTGYSVYNIEKKDDTYSTVYLSFSDKSSIPLGNLDIKYVIAEFPSNDLSIAGIEKGSSVCLIYNVVRLKKEIIDDKCYIDVNSGSCTIQKFGNS